MKNEALSLDSPVAAENFPAKQEMKTCNVFEF